MTRNPEFLEFLQELAPNPDTVGTIESSKATIIMDADGKELIFSKDECERVLQCPETLKVFLDIIEIEPKTADIELAGLEVTDEVMDELCKHFNAVDEC